MRKGICPIGIEDFPYKSRVLFAMWKNRPCFGEKRTQKGIVVPKKRRNEVFLRSFFFSQIFIGLVIRLINYFFSINDVDSVLGRFPLHFSTRDVVYDVVRVFSLWLRDTCASSGRFAGVLIWVHL